ncbi:Maintenance of telomere capping protein 6 [Friedmanniomyces endolithicus]|uniref:Maintenance of telomere capping protein 6 n=1 Tax=Friedmanniomyces endolithicus TaxID=329885 RepID=A0AAN6R0R4_9PEZI|nr:Maintenance of telomere capping protein 6 [Friedmanniomyces endolithicus]KAK0292397.1 Maintenance of telomere capping protein 6 [Friedmanniomyces endolithicus]KAK0321737.1 Maintenance of telomere capping protein 6 [Friedmanniomyces endolithicus]KAK0920834.1 Maintenance of telomere capping protein 6 [Friedmanniomyces endolithicus]KAK0998343.1 Maintenance of telomere capping protein 6 [Friedmanniomyces endolithicus]
MSLYGPDAGAVPRGIAFISLLSQRDLSLQLPINYVTVPGVSLTAACFPNKRYEDATAARCISNLLATGFRRIEADIYWDTSRRLWSLCPVQLGNTSTLSNSTMTTAEPSSRSTSSAMLASGQLTNRGAIKEARATFANGAQRRQDSSLSLTIPTAPADSTAASSVLPSVSSTATLTAGASGTSVVATSSASGTSPPDSSQNLLIEVGPYSCTPSADFKLLTTVLSGYLEDTETDLNATTRYLILNLHAAAPASDPSGSPQKPATSALPQQGDLISSIISSNNSIYLYTPTELLAERASLNYTETSSASSSYYQPDTAYFTVTVVNNQQTTSDSWPSEGYIELGKAKRLLTTYGTVDPQMTGYNFSGDAAYLFPPGYLQATPQVTTKAGAVTGGCFFQPGVDHISAINSSWSTTTIDATTQQSDILPLVANLTSCGISALLNTTLNNIDAATDYTPYQAYAYAANWAWSDGEPRNTSVSGSKVSCAALNATSGRWQATDCAQTHYGACRIGHTPYKWQISSQQGHYTNLDEGCPYNTTFAVPRTALENSYLLAAWRDYRKITYGESDPMLWLNFNDLSTDACWVRGQNGSCPYLPTKSDAQGGQILVPTVAAIIVFVLAALTIFVKCAANRQSARSKRRRVDDRWDYEGVPS